MCVPYLMSERSPFLKGIKTAPEGHGYVDFGRNASVQKTLQANSYPFLGENLPECKLIRALEARDTSECGDQQIQTIVSLGA